jgi:2-dehydro-3-deoxyphosphogluconate aldolase/(4S)-4-hydroxy-2-oxoglutarate aldolase
LTADPIRAAGVVPLFNHSDPAIAAEAAAACAEGGATAIEVTDRVAGTEAAISAVARRLEADGSGAVVGAGSVVDARRADVLIAAGARFVVSPGLSEPVAIACDRAGVPYVPGCATASEVIRARDLGLELTKIFPAAALGGPAYIRALRAAMPWMGAMPTGGVRNDVAELAEYVRAGAVCVGLGSDLVERATLDRRDWPALTRAVARAVAAVRDARTELSE